MLGPEDYGILAALMGAVFLLGAPSEAIQTIISRYTSRFLNDNDKIKGIFIKSLKKTFIIGVIFILILAALSGIIGDALKVDFKYIIILGFFFFGFVMLSAVRGVLQGKKKFAQLGSSLIIESVTKIIFTPLFIILGLKVYGALGAILFSFVISFFISLLFIKEVIKARKDSTRIDGIYNYSWLIFISTLCIIAFYSLDIIFARIFFSANDAGMYAAISDLGKMIFWGTAPISKAMLPIISEKRDKQTSARKDIKGAILLVAGICIIGLTLFAIFPEMLLKIFYGEEYIKFSSLLAYFGISMFFLAITNIFIYDLMSKGSRESLYLILFVAIQIGFVMTSHANIFQFITALIASNFLTLLFFAFVYFSKRKT
jgi:O-antigen/teichoic acid export membrane protein